MKSLYAPIRTDYIKKHYLPLVVGNNSIEHYFIEKTPEINGIVSLRFAVTRVLQDEVAP